MTAHATLAQPADTVITPFQTQPFNDPLQMFDGLFGTDAQAEQETLKNVELSSEEEQRIGQDAADVYLNWLRKQRVRLVTTGRDVEYLQALIDVVQPQMENADRYDDIHVVVARSPLTDARSFPGGTLVVFDGLLDFADSEAAVAGVIGHELSHLDRGHQLVRVKSQRLAEQAFANASTGRRSSFLNMAPLLMRVWSRPFRPEDEAEADRDGARWAYQAGYDPREMAKLFLRLHERNRSQGNNITLPSFLRSHPYEVQRHAAVMNLYDELQSIEPRGDLYVGQENLQHRKARHVESAED